MTRILFLAGLACLSFAVGAEDVLIQNVRIFNGVDATLTPGHVLVADGLIAKVADDPIDPPEGSRVIDGGNRVLSPGFIDLHVHLSGHVPSEQIDAYSTLSNVYATIVAKHYLDSGFTSIRDAGGTHPHFARAIDTGAIAGPRVFPSGAYLSQTAGHGDFRFGDQPNPSLHGGSHYLYNGTSVLVDGVDQHLAAARENLRFGATQIKIMGGGGVISWAAVASCRNSIRSIHCSRRRPRYVRRYRRQAIGAPTYSHMLTQAKPCAGLSITA
jgi:imidazolonepropionase-like amidohydrolase